VYTFCVTYHVAVTYEDVPLDSAADLVDVTSAISASPRRVYIPRGGPLQFAYAVNPQDGSPVDVTSAISGAIAAHRLSGYPGEYTLMASGGMLHVVPAAAEGKDGERREISALMNESFTLPSERVTQVGPVLRAVLRAAGKSRGRQIVLASPLPHQFEETPFPMESRPLSARDWVSKALAAGGLEMSWLLLYDATFDNYVFTLYPI